jgi:SAM-dependent methyltransferase
VTTPNVTFMQADLTRMWPCKRAYAGLIVCNLVLEHIADLSFIFAEAGRVLRSGGEFLLSELHPFRQYQGVKANFQREEETTEIAAFIHNLSDYWDAATANGFEVKFLRECWHADDDGKPPRIISFIFQKK